MESQIFYELVHEEPGLEPGTFSFVRYGLYSNLDDAVKDFAHFLKTVDINKPTSIHEIILGRNNVIDEDGDVDMYTIPQVLYSPVEGRLVRYTRYCCGMEAYYKGTYQKTIEESDRHSDEEEYAFDHSFSYRLPEDFPQTNNRTNSWGEDNDGD